MYSENVTKSAFLSLNLRWILHPIVVKRNLWIILKTNTINVFPTNTVFQENCSQYLFVRNQFEFSRHLLLPKESKQSLQLVADLIKKWWENKPCTVHSSSWNEHRNSWKFVDLIFITLSEKTIHEFVSRKAKKKVKYFWQEHL